MKRFVRALWLGLALVGGARAAVPAIPAIPFEYREGLLWIQVEAPQSGRPLYFLFDTGASVSVINADTAAVLGLAGGGKISVQGVQATTAGRWPVRFSAFAGGLALPTNYLTLDLSRLAQSCGRPLDGLLGADFIQGRVVEIDFQARLLRFPASARPAKTDVVLPLKLRNDCYVVSARVNERKRQWLRLDTGCASALQWVTTGNSALTTVSRPAIGLAGCLIPQAETTVCLGDRKFDHVPTGIHHAAIFADEAGLLGNGLLSRFKTVTIDAKSARLFLTPK